MCRQFIYTIKRNTNFSCKIKEVAFFVSRGLLPDMFLKKVGKTDVKMFVYKSKISLDLIKVLSKSKIFKYNFIIFFIRFNFDEFLKTF